LFPFKTHAFHSTEPDPCPVKNPCGHQGVR
jgi:hypothetical protein